MGTFFLGCVQVSQKGQSDCPRNLKKRRPFHEKDDRPVGAALTLTAVLTACGQKQESRTPEELTQVYADALTENGGEMVEYNP